MFEYDDKMNFADIPLLRRDRNCTRDPLQDQPKANGHNRESHLQDFAKLQDHYWDAKSQLQNGYNYYTYRTTI